MTHINNDMNEQKQVDDKNLTDKMKEAPMIYVSEHLKITDLETGNVIISMRA